MSDNDLFGGTLPDPEPTPDLYEGMGQDARRTAKRRELLASGIHPATKMRLSVTHSDKTCGECAHLWVKGVDSGKVFFKCTEASRLRADGLHGPDMRKSWPACSLFKECGA